MTKIQVVIAEDEELFRKGLIQLIGGHPEIEVIGEASDGQKLMDLLGSGIAPDIVLLDLKMPNMDGIQATKLMKKEYPDIRIVVLTSHYAKLFITNMVQLGASAFHRKDSSPDSIINTILEVNKTGYHYDSETLEVIQKSFVTGDAVRKSSFGESILSDREKEVLSLICKQKKTSEIAEELFISTRTVDGHRNNLLLKTGSKNVAGLVLYAVEHGIHLI